MTNSWNGKKQLSWKYVETCVKLISSKLEKMGYSFDAIATVSRGGLVPARLVADNLDIKKILVDKQHIPKNVLFVDDIYDSGDTFRKVYPKFESKNFVYATLVARKGKSYPKQLVYAKKTIGNEYVIFPWDKLEFSRSRKK